MHPDANRLTFALLPIPVRKQVQDRIVSPPGFVVIKMVLGESANTDDAKLRVDRRPAVGCRLPAVVKASPGKASRKPFARGVELPPLFRQFGPRRMIGVIGTDPVTKLIGLVNAPG